MSPHVLALGAGVDEDVLARVFLAVGVVIVVARLAGLAAKRLRQPAVVGEIIGGILLGPTLLGAFPGDLDLRLFPLETRESLGVVANLGLIVFMFIVGLELDVGLIKGKERIAGSISLSSIVLPLGLGLLLAAALHPDHKVVGGTEVEFVPFALFIGASMSITAFPVLARIMVDRGMYRTSIGALTLACAAVDDVLAWALLAIVLAVIESGTFFTWDFPRILGLSVLFAAALALVVRPLLGRLVPAHRAAGRLTPGLAAVVFVGLLLSAYATSEIGVHHILGAFTFGAMMPRRDAGPLTHDVLQSLEQMTVVLLLPVFFVTTGLSVDVGALSVGDLGTLGLILLTACAGKFIGATGAARAQGIRPWRKAAAIGTLMNTRGLTELIILSVGREAGVLDDTLFTLLVLMAVITTVMTEPALRLFYPDRMLARDIAEAERGALAVDDARRLLVSIDDVDQAGVSLGLAADLARFGRPTEVVLTRLISVEAAPEFGILSPDRLEAMTTSMDSLATLERALEATGVAGNVVTRFSTEPDNDLVSAAATLLADALVIVDDRDCRARSLTRATDRTVLRCRPDPAPRLESPIGGLPVVVWAAEGDHGAVALDVAVRLAFGTGSHVVLVADGRRARRWQSAMAPLRRWLRIDVVHPEAPTLAARAVVVAGDAPLPAAWTVAVHVPEDLGRTIDDTVERIRREIGPAGGSGGVPTASGSPSNDPPTDQARDLEIAGSSTGED